MKAANREEPSIICASLAHKTGRVFRVAAAFVSWDFGILAYEPFAHHDAVLVVIERQFFGCFPRLFPLLDHTKRVVVKVFISGRSWAVAHPGHHEEPHGLAHLLVAGFSKDSF